MILPPPFVPQGSVFRGVGVGHGLAIGPVHIIHSSKIRHSRYKLTTPAMVESELARLRQARERTTEKLLAAQKSLPAELFSEGGDIFTTHLMLLNDPHLFSQAEKMIAERRINAEAALVASLDQYIKIVSSFENEYLKSRAYDIETVSNSLVATLQENEPGSLVAFERGCVVVS
ncbi:MAG: hypothetical protein LBL95_06990, partial [Deltaproteobacteria bacterium]|nr:hypothetical protein [Deltaproteobacteria bacterium]